MKVGIITFHWATNYGAVLQTFALQECLRSKGYDVEIINYKPRHYDFWSKYLYNPVLIRYLKRDLTSRRKEQKLKDFRNNYLKLTRRYYTTAELCDQITDYELIVSGSDQVLNPYFTTKGERKPAAAYYLPFCDNAKKVGYAVSFGCTDYSGNAFEYAQKWINNFDRIGVRETTGVEILSQIGFNGINAVVPDPTILRGKQLITDVLREQFDRTDNICVYMLRSSINLSVENVIYIDDFKNPLSMKEWVRTISTARFMITNSYHGMIVSILSHTPFAVLMESTKYSGMNDRFTTLLSLLDLESRVISNPEDLYRLQHHDIDWLEIDKKLAEYQKVGSDFIGF